MRSSVILVLAFALDLLVGDPRWFPHPVRIIGRMISIVEGLLRPFCTSAVLEKTAGIVLVLSIAGVSGLGAIGMQKSTELVSVYVSTYFGGLLMVWFVSTTIATRELIDSVKLVIGSIKSRKLDEARFHLSRIVGRDTEHLSEQEVLKAALETLAENLSDGIIAPLFYLAMGGFPAAMVYKAINTLDSMVGYRNDRYIHFGWAAARMDDVANYVPARITGLIIVLATFISSLSVRTNELSGRTLSSLRVLRRDGRNHTSPNSGIPEAAMAGALGVRMGGPSSYGGSMVEKPYIGDQERGDFLEASAQAIRIAYVVSCIGAAAAGTMLSFWSVL